MSDAPQSRFDHPGLRSVRADVDAGRLWKARDRLHGMLAWKGQGPGTPPRDVVLDALGEVYAAMLDLPEAGRHWFLTGREDEEANAAIAAWRARHGDSSRALLESLRKLLDAPGPKLTPVARARLEELRERAPASVRTRMAPPGEFDSGNGWSDVFWGVVVFAGTVGIWVVGVVALVRWLL